MKRFSDRLDSILESVIDYPKPTLDGSVWAADATLRPEIRRAIFDGVRRFAQIAPITKIMIIGGIATYNYSADSDIDINLEAATTTDEELLELRHLVLELNGLKVFGTHPLNWWVTDNFDATRYDSIYDVKNNTWVSGPKAINIELYKYLDEFESKIKTIDLLKMELMHETMSYDMLASMPVADRRQIHHLARERLKIINRDVDKIADLYDEILTDRRTAFSGPDPKELQQYKTKSALPDNIIFLLLRKYCYTNFLKAIDDLPNTVQGRDVGTIQKITTTRPCRGNF